MGLLYDAAHKIVEHIRTRDSNFGLQTALAQDFQRKGVALDKAYRQLVEMVPWPTGVPILARLPDYRCQEGCVVWQEIWTYPAADLLMYRDGFPPYESATRPLPPGGVLVWEETLQVELEEQSRWLFVEIPLTPCPWLEPRFMGKEFRKLAKKADRPATEPERVFLEDFRQPNPYIGQPVWRIHASEVTSPAEVLTQLMIGARKFHFPTSDEDMDAVSQWVHGVVSDELSGEVFEALIKRFDLPSSDLGLRNYIKKTVRGLKLDELKKNNPSVPEPYIDSASGVRMYPDARVARDVDCHKKTVARWKEDNDIQTKGLSEEQKAAFISEWEQKQERQQLTKRYKDAREVSYKSAQKQIERWENIGLSLEEIRQEVKKEALVKVLVIKKRMRQKDAKQYVACRLRQGATPEDIAKDVIGDAGKEE